VGAGAVVGAGVAAGAQAESTNAAISIKLIRVKIFRVISFSFCISNGSIFKIGDL
jgi:hypothetical protein